MSNRFMYIILTAGVLLTVALIYVTIYEHKKWNAFAKKHNCVVVSTVKGHNVTTLIDGTYAVSFVPGNTTYRCDDGVLYTRPN